MAFQCRTPEQDDYKIARFAQLGLMPTAMKTDPYFPAMNWSGASGVMEIDGSRRDRLSNSAQKKFRRWSRRLNGQHANGTGWIMVHEPSRSANCTPDGAAGRSYVRRRARSQGPPSFPRSAKQKQLPYSCDVAVPSNPRRKWFSRSERHLSKLQQRQMTCDDEPLATELPQLPTGKITKRFTLVKPPLPYYVSPLQTDTPDRPSPVHSRSEQSKSAALGSSLHDRTDGTTEKSVASEIECRRPICQSQQKKYDKGKSPEKNPVSSNAPDIVKELRGRKIESPCKLKPNSAPISLPLDANTFFGTKDKSRRPSIDLKSTRRFSIDLGAPSLDKPRRLSVDSGPRILGTSRRLSTDFTAQRIDVLQDISITPADTPISSNNQTKSNTRAARLRSSSQDSDISIIAVFNARDNRKKPTEETPRSCGPKSSKKSAEIESNTTPSSSETTAGTHRRNSTEAQKIEPPKRSSPSGDLKPKALIKPGLRNAKKDPSKAPGAAKPGRRRSTPSKVASEAERKLVQKTLDSFFCKSAESGNQTGAKGTKDEEPRSARKVSAGAERPAGPAPVMEETRCHIRRIYQDDELKLPVVRVTPLELPQLPSDRSGRGTATTPSVRLTHLTLIPSPAKKRPCEEASSPPRKISRRANSDTIVSENDAVTKYDTVRDLSPSCPLKKVFSVSKPSVNAEALDRKEQIERSLERSPTSAKKSSRDRSPSSMKQSSRERRHSSTKKSSRERSHSKKKSSRERSHSEKRSSRERCHSRKRSSRERSHSKKRSSRERSRSKKRSSQERSHSKKRGSQDRIHSEKRRSRDRSHSKKRSSRERSHSKKRSSQERSHSEKRSSRERSRYEKRSSQEGSHSKKRSSQERSHSKKRSSPERSPSCTKSKSSQSRDSSKEIYQKSSERPVEEDARDTEWISKNTKRSSPRKSSKKYRKWKRSPSKKSIIGPSDLSYLFRQAYLEARSVDDKTQKCDTVNRSLNSSKDKSTDTKNPKAEPSVCLELKVKSPARVQDPFGTFPVEHATAASGPNSFIHDSGVNSKDKQDLTLNAPSPRVRDACGRYVGANVRPDPGRVENTGIYSDKPVLMNQDVTLARASTAPATPAQPRKTSDSPAPSPARSCRRSPTRASDCGSPAQIPSSESKTRTESAGLVLRSATPKKTVAVSPTKKVVSPTKTAVSPTKKIVSPTTMAVSPTKTAVSPTKKAVSPTKTAVSPTKKAVSPARPVRLSPAKRAVTGLENVVVQPEEELLQAQQDRAASAAEALKAAQRNKQRHSRGRKVYEYCPALDEHLERHPVQNEVSADKWIKWLNPTQLRCLSLAMLDNTDLCLRYSSEARVVRWEAAWIELSRRLNSVCYNRLTNLNTGLRLTVAEWKKLWLDMRSLIRSRVEAMKPAQRRHGLGSLECLLYSENLYAALMKSNGECLGDDCPRIWCSGACVGVFCPTIEPSNRRATEE